MNPFRRQLVGQLRQWPAGDNARSDRESTGPFYKVRAHFIYAHPFSFELASLRESL
jgi:hypothetical protein